LLIRPQLERIFHFRADHLPGKDGQGMS
jgi:hypothetical protein